MCHEALTAQRDVSLHTERVSCADVAQRLPGLQLRSKYFLVWDIPGRRLEINISKH
jgi:hypothetical protein